MNLNKLFLIPLMISSSVFGQDVGTTEIKILEGFKPVIPQATRLNDNASFEDTLKKDRTQIFEILDAKLGSDYKIKPLAVAKIKNAKITKLYKSQIAAAFGNSFISNASILYNSNRSKNFSYGIIANHSSNKYFPSQNIVKNSKNFMSLYAKKVNVSNIFLLNMEYDRRSSLYFNQDAAFGLIEKKDFRNRFAYTKLSLSAISISDAKDALKHHTIVSISDLNELSENQLHLLSNLRKTTLNNFTYNLGIEFDNYFRYNNSDSKVENSSLKIVTLSPSSSFKRFDYNFDIGFDITALNNLPVEFFPELKITKELVNDILLVYGGINHHVQTHTIKSLSDENPYIHSFGTNQHILVDSVFTHELRNTYFQSLYFGIKNFLSKNEVLEVNSSYGFIKNFSHFTPLATQSYNRFKIQYFNQNVRQLHLNANYSKQLNKIITIKGDVNYYDWDVEVYHRANVTSNISASLNFRDKIKLDPSISYLGRRVVFNNTLVELPEIIHVDLDFYYFYSNQISASLQLNNLTNSKQDIWLGYRELAFNARIGINFSF